MMLKGYMVNHGITYEEMAQKIGVSVGYLSNIANGKKTNVNLDLFYKIVRETGMDANALLDDFMRLYRESLGE